MKIWTAGAEPWLTEPDREEWVSAGGSRCLVRRGAMGALCGYVAVSVGHPWHGLDWVDIPAHVHGGCTWVGPLDGEGSTWWVGFDCGRGGSDVIPGLIVLPLPSDLVRRLFKGCEYRTIDYVRNETNELAAQAELAAKGAVFGREVEGEQ